MVEFAVKTPPHHAEWADLLAVWRAAERHSETVGRDPAEIRRSIHLRWHAGADLAELADTALAYGQAGVDVVILGMQHPYDAGRLEPLASVLADRAA